jgi:hypothetical protein
MMIDIRPSKRPKVSQVSNWHIIFNEGIETHWRGDDYAGDVDVAIGYPFPDFYRVTFFPKSGKKSMKLFYGESAWSQVEMYVYDLGFHNVLGRI